MTRALVMHSEWDARDAVARGLADGAVLLSTHPAVDLYLQGRGLRSSCISGLLTLEEVIAERARTYRNVDRVLASLDGRFAEDIGVQTGLAMDYFRPLYSYAGKYHWMAYACFALTVRRAVETHGIDALEVYDWRFQRFLEAKTRMGDLLAACVPELGASVVARGATADRQARSAARRLTVRKRLDVARLARRLARRVAKRSSVKRPVAGQRCLVLFEPLYDMSFLLDELRDTGVVYYPGRGLPPLGETARHFSGTVSVDIEGVEPEVVSPDDLPIARLFAKDVTDDLTTNATAYLSEVLTLDRTVRTYRPSAAVWGLAPAVGAAALCTEYLLRTGVPVVGSQHGILYGETLNLQRETDLDRCDYFISSGFTCDDFERLCPGATYRAEILPYGWVESVHVKESQREIDVLFPITNTYGLLEDGMLRMPPDALLDRQIELLRYLDGLEGRSVYVKPMAFATLHDCAALPLVREMKNLTLVEDITLTRFLERHRPRLSLVEFPSQPLCDLVQIDTEIVLMPDPVLPWEAQALDEVGRRAHFAETTAEAIALMDGFFAGTLETKRDRAYLEHYIRKDDARDKVTGLVRTLAAREPRYDAAQTRRRSSDGEHADPGHRVTDDDAR